MLKGFDYILPTKIRFGAGIIRELGDEIKKENKQKVFIVTDKGLIKAGIVDKVLEVLKNNGIDMVKVYDEVEPNPRTGNVNHGYEVAKEFGAEVLLAVGGGSSIDTAKGIGTLLAGGGIIEDYEGFDKVKGEMPPFIAIPTTVGTGSEVTPWAVITDLKRSFKMSVADVKLYPKIALLDSDLVQGLPPRIIASTGMDALSHAIESYTCKIAQPITDAIALYGIELIGKNIRNAVYTDDYDAKANMLIGSMFGGFALSNADIAGVHCMGEALGGMYDTPHGIANSVVLPYVMEYNYIASMTKHALIAKALGVDTSDMTEREAAMASVAAVKELNADLGIPTLKEVGVKEEDFQALAEKSEANMSNPDNPRLATSKDYYEMFVKAYNGQ